jgi:putative spermidine/putrescine transport system substrate-binding protein
VYPRERAPVARSPLVLRYLPWLAAALCLLLAAAAKAEPAKLDQLVVREFPGPWGDAFETTIGQMFTAKYGIPVVIDHRPDTTVSLLIETALAQGRPPPVDAAISLENATFKEAARGVMQELTVEDIPNLADMLPIAHPVGHPDDYPYVNFATDILTLVYRKSAFPDGPPTSLKMMFDPRFKGRILVGSTSLLTVMLVSLANDWQIPADMDKIWTFIQDKVKPMDPLMGTDADVVNGLQRDEIDLTFTYPYMAAGMEDLGIGWTSTKEGMYGLNEGLWMPRGLPPANAYWAKQFINFVLSHDVLQAYCTKLDIPCFRKDITPPPGAEKDPYFPITPAQFASIHSTPFQAYTANQLDWDARYDAIMK